MLKKLIEKLLFFHSQVENSNLAIEYNSETGYFAFQLEYKDKLGLDCIKEIAVDNVEFINDFADKIIDDLNLVLVTKNLSIEFINEKQI